MPTKVNSEPPGLTGKYLSAGRTLDELSSIRGDKGTMLLPGHILLNPKTDEFLCVVGIEPISFLRGYDGTKMVPLVGNDRFILWGQRKLVALVGGI